MPFNTNLPLKQAIEELLALLHAILKRKIKATKYFTIGCLDKTGIINLARSRKGRLTVIFHVIFSYTNLINYISHNLNIYFVRNPLLQFG